MKLFLKSCILAFTLTAGAMASAHAADTTGYPKRPVTIIVTMAPGGSTDIVGRLLAQRLAESFGQPFIVENRPGAGGNIGSQVVARAPHDGYTLMVQLSSTQVINPSLYAKPGFDPIKDFEPITTIVKVPYVLVVPPSSPLHSVKDLLNAAKAKPMQYGSAGNGTPNHLLAEMLATMEGIKLEHVPYKGAAFATTATASGEVPFSFGAVPTVMGQVKGNMVRPIGISSTERSPALPDVPPIADTVPGFSGDAWVGLFAPAGTPKDIIEKIHAEVLKVLRTTDLKEKLTAQGATVSTLTPAQFGALIKDDLVQWAKIVKSSGATVN
ncbi:MAG: extra-cytoplasmic solute receptor [Herminiimonas sp.]|nr:extra-cytoplasmic solute receptor [Herminiimonas sp.]